MNVSFATCCKHTALGYLKKVYPGEEGRITVEAEPVERLLDLVGEDVLRIQDPMMYGNRIGIVPGKKYKSEDEARARQVAVNFSDYMNNH